MKKFLGICLLIGFLLTFSTQATAIELHSMNLLPVLYEDGMHGINIVTGSLELYKEQLILADPEWVRTGISWKDTEAVKGIYNWNPGFDNDLKILDSLGTKNLVVLFLSPPWASEDSRSCSRIKGGNIPDFVNFVEQVILKYPTIKYLEIWNEPDAYPGEDPYYGCWGNPEEPYLGGYYYADVMNAVYTLKDKYPYVQFVYGGLIDVRNGYLEGSLKMEVNVDMVSFHFYDWYSNPSHGLKDEIIYLQDLLKKYNKDIPLLLTETSLLCAEGSTKCTEDFLQKQADYINEITQAVKGTKVEGWMWYALNCTQWNNSGLLNLDGTYKPVFERFKDLSR